MAQRKPEEVVNAFLAAVAERDFPLARRWLSDKQFSTHSPISTFHSADAFITDVARVGPILERLERRKLFVDGDDVCVIVNYVTHMDRRQVTPVVHWMKIDNDKISSIETFFDARGYAEMFVLE